MKDPQLAERLGAIREQIERACKKSGRRVDDIRLIAVTKNHPASMIQDLIDLGVRDFGENRVNEITEKVPLLKGDFTMHMIGHLQTNKVKKVLPYVKWIQSIDRGRLIAKIENVYGQCHEKMRVLVEVNTSGEESKSGCKPEECLELCERVVGSSVLELKGLMTIGPLGADESATRNSFALLRELGDRCRSLIDGTVELSMGMSGDFEWAIEEGATMIRIGTVLVGKRFYI
ncbi:YggS family pyridoxal phosphate-dependent enzyme [Chitinispirillales bacterium ANBcel5]|uniref:YggS family pyridoxal phosphate-dependent enzyme n=1 Tax=Cellulosispirillum alkaliphilum TaxID=3039283 RepID=UPI002A55E346|nr:YggS family pyridoxal phosphate-dependent enzyme [Chitinispirillales bacterium ANBcel5]